MDPIKKITGERDALLAENRRIRKAVTNYIADPSSRSIGVLKRELDHPAPSHLFAVRKGGFSL